MSGSRNPVTATLLAEHPSLKRLAWAYGCASKGSDEEQQLEQMLRERVLAEQKELPR